MRSRNTPKLIFRRSWLYAQALSRGRGFKRPPEKRFSSRLRQLERTWFRHGNKILKEIARVTKLNWNEKEIVCYLTYGVIAYSDPLTLNMRSNMDALTHELIHRILSEPENWKKIRHNWEMIMKKYRNEPQRTKTHIVIHAIHTAILKKLFGETRLKKEKKDIRDPRYIRSWVIVDTDGYKNIINELNTGLS